MLKYFAGFGFCKILKYVWPNTFPFNSLNMPCGFPQKFEPYVSDSFTLNSSTCLGRIMWSPKASWTLFVGAFILVGKQLEPELRNPGSSFNAQIPPRIREFWTGWAHFAFDAASLQTLQLGGIILIVHSPLVTFILEDVSKSLML